MISIGTTTYQTRRLASLPLVGMLILIACSATIDHFCLAVLILSIP
jgi:hypothetical protein